MPRIVSIRGWVECPQSMKQEVKDYISKYKERTSTITQEQLVSCSKGWVIDLENGDDFVFYGNYFNEKNLEFLEEQLHEIIARRVSSSDTEIDEDVVLASMYVTSADDCEEFMWEFCKNRKVSKVAR